ncbi:MAG: hypothetical protein H6818_15195 [Phycisphaerales bacterium]|nr:hypothetical protein [Phycisphaerales bacterium]MCB9861849.1 hypothetical protein [Phycisphaerales bacterium]
MNNSDRSHRQRTRTLLDRVLLRFRGLMRRIGEPHVAERHVGVVSHLPACYSVE